MWIMTLQNSHAYVGTKGTLYYHISSYSRNGELGYIDKPKATQHCHAAVAMQLFS